MVLALFKTKKKNIRAKIMPLNFRVRLMCYSAFTETGANQTMKANQKAELKN